MSVLLGSHLSLDTFIQVATHHAPLAFSKEYQNRVTRSRELIEQAISENRAIYGVTTGFGSLSTRCIDKTDMEKLQENIILSHACSVGAPLTIPQVRGIMLMMLQNLGQGHSGVRLILLERIAQLLNRGLTPYVPGEGSVGYLSLEAHIALVLLGKGKAYYKGELLLGNEALQQAGISPITLAAKEGLALISGTTSPTALSALALHDMLVAAKSADIIACLSLEVQKGVLNAFDPRVIATRPHKGQMQVAENVRNILANSGILEHYKGQRLQDALSLRAISQLHGATKENLEQAKKTIEIEMNSCCDNPQIFEENNEPIVISACNCDSSYVGLSMDSAAIAVTLLGKISERRTSRLLDEHLSGYPAFLVKNPGLNSGLMIPQYTQAGLLNEMRVLAHPATIDNTPTCAGQEDYVAMGYTAAKKAGKVSQHLQYILAIELLTAVEAYEFLPKDLSPAPVTAAVIAEVRKFVSKIEEDRFLGDHIHQLMTFIQDGSLLNVVLEIVEVI